jgi:hypothetical protein
MGVLGLVTIFLLSFLVIKHLAGASESGRARLAARILTLPILYLFVWFAVMLALRASEMVS